jgi:hypothetical protein
MWAGGDSGAGPNVISFVRMIGRQHIAPVQLVPDQEDDAGDDPPIIEP